VVLALATAFRFYFVSWLGSGRSRTSASRCRPICCGWRPAISRRSPLRDRQPLTADTAIIEQVVGSTISIALRNVVIGIGGTIYLFALSPKLTLSLLVCIPLVVLPIVLLGKKVRSYSRDSQDRLADIGAIAVETLGAMKVVQAFGQERREAERFEHAVSNGFATSRKRFLLRAVMTAMVIGLFFGGLTLLLWEAVADVASGRLSGGSLTAFVVTGMLVAGSFQALTEVWGDILRASGAAQRLAELLAEQPEIAPPPPPPSCRSCRWARCDSSMSCSIIRPGPRSPR
jgi:ATP-binding cassette subfamily B protein